MHKRYCITVIFFFVISLITFSSLTFCIDPFFHYHKPWFGLKPLVTNQTYQNAGIAKNFEYDSVLTGSSMVENFRSSWFDSAFGINTVKLPYSGGRSKNYDILFSQIFKYKRIKYIFYGLDIYALTGDYQTARFTIPEYLYDDNIFNDVNYLLNKDMLFQEIPNVVSFNRRGEVVDFDDAYTWEKLFTFSQAEALKMYSRLPEKQTMKRNDYLIEKTDMNLKNIIPHIKSNPTTEFYIFFPPYSILYWDNQIRSGDFDASMYALEYAIDKFLEYNNVKLYYFQNNKEIITNLDNYKDYTHYSAKINKFMLDSMKEGKFLLTKGNYKEEVYKMDKLVKGYDFSKYFSN